MVAVSYHNHIVKGVNVAPRFLSLKACHSLTADLIYSFKLSVQNIKFFVGVSESTVYRWIHQSDDHISCKNYQKLISLYCHYYLKNRDEKSEYQREENNVEEMS